jgi:hypothetical protein
MLNRGFATMFRSFEMRQLRFTHCCVRWKDEIGHNGGSMNPHVVTNNGKANVNGHLEYTAFLRHVNALQDTAASDGCCFFQRFGRLFEDVPDFRQWRATKKLTLYRGHASRASPVSKSHMNGHWTEQFRAYDIVCGKLTHQPRVQGQQYLDNCGVDIIQITRIARHKQQGSSWERGLTPVQQRSYLLNPPIQAIVAAAGGNWRYPQCHDPAWGKVTAEMQVLLDQLIDAIVPRLRQRYNEVHELFAVTRSYNQRKENRLFMAKGAIHYIKFAMEHALLMLASRPVRKVNGQWTLQTQSPTYYHLSDNTNQNSFFSLAPFHGAAFQQLTALVAQAQNREVEMLTHLNMAAETVLGTTIRDTMQPLYHSVDQAFIGMRNEQAEFRNAMLQQQNAMAAQQAAFIARADNFMGTHGNGNIQMPLLPQRMLPPPPPPPPPENEDVLYGNDVPASLQEYWEQYDIGRAGRTPFKVRERLDGTAWRLPLHPQWWGRHRCMYALVLHFKSQSRSTAEALELANPIYLSGQRNGQPHQERSKAAINAYFRTHGVTTKDVSRLLKDYENQG